MATIFPQKEDLTGLPYSELRVYELLEKLPSTYYVFHSVQWVKKSSKWVSTWKENDFLILNKSLGCLVLEIKGGDIECHGGVFHQINTATKEVSVLDPNKKNDPLSQAIDGVYHYRKLLDKISDNLSERFPVEAAAWFSSCTIGNKMSQFPLKYREISGAVLGNEHFAKGSTAIQDVFGFYKNYEKTHVTDDEFRKIIDMIASDFELITAPAAKRGELDHAFLKLTNEQTGLLDYISEQKNATIQGVAGTGKTLIAKEAARRFGEDDRKVLFLCFNRLLYLDLQKRYPHENVTYLNINAFLAQYRPGADTSTTALRVEELRKIDIDELEFDDVIIDEAQDFANEEILFFKDYSELRDGHFFVFYDKNQLLTTREVPKWITDSECKLLLTKNCRNTRQIALTAYNVIDVELNQKIMMVDGDQTTISFVKGNPLPALSRLVTSLSGEEYGYQPEEIVILSMKTENSSILSGVSNLGRLPVLSERDKSVFFTSSRKFKGLESKVVIIIDIDADCFANEEQKRNFYVACSRATQKLVLFINADDTQVSSIAEAISGNRKFAPKGRIAMKTQSAILDL